MKSLILLSAAALTLAFFAPVAQAGAQAKPSAEDILRLVRFSQAAQEQSFTGHIRPQLSGNTHLGLFLVHIRA